MAFIGLAIFFWSYGAEVAAKAERSGKNRLRDIASTPEMRALLNIPSAAPDRRGDKKGLSLRLGSERRRLNDEIPVKGLKADLARADLPISVTEFWLISVGLGSVLFLVLTLTGHPVITAIALGLIGFYGPRWYVKRRKNNRIAKFTAQLADALQGMAATLRSGGSIQVALNEVVRGGQEPIKGEFDLVIKQIAVGEALPDALDALTRRIPSTDLEFVAIAIKINAEVGGQLADILQAVGETIRKRDELNGKVQTLTAQANMTIKFMLGLPVVAMGAMSLLQPATMTNFTEALCGRIIIAVVVVLMLIGYFLAKKLGTVKV